MLETYRLLRRNRQLAERRDPMYEQNKAAKWLIGFSSFFIVAYLIMFGGIIAMAANESRRLTAPEVLMSLSPFILTVDFYVRFMAQQTPSQIIKPYVLLPLPRYACVDAFILSSLTSYGNLTWGFLLVPFCLMSVVFGYGVWTALSLLLLFYLLVLANSQWYSICRTLILGSMVWWLLPLSLTGALVAGIILADVKTVFRFFSHMGSGLEYDNLLPHLAALAALVVLALINRRLQYANVMREVARVEDARAKALVRLDFLDRLSGIGEYIKLEINLIIRNKNPRKAFISGFVLVVAMSLLISTTEIYDGRFMANFWCIYDYVIFSQMVLSRLMCYEANYIDCLMVHRENILTMLRAKYYLYCVLLLLPFLLMLPMVFVGKWSIWMLLSYGLFTAGFQHAMIMQLTVYNTQKMPLNEKFIGKGGMENSYVQIVISLAVFALPITIIQLMEAFLPDWVAWSVMAIIGVAFITTHNLWLRNIYSRLMARRYKNMEAMHT